MLFIRGMVDKISFSELQKSRLMLHKTNNECFKFVRWYSYFHSVKDKCSIQLGFASLNRTFHLSPHENICTIALITIHYLYNIEYTLRKIILKL